MMINKQLVKMLDHHNIKFDSILISLQKFLIADLCWYLCYSAQSLLVPLYRVKLSI